MLEYFCSASLPLIVWYSLILVMEFRSNIITNYSDILTFLLVVIILDLNCPLMYYNYVRIIMLCELKKNTFFIYLQTKIMCMKHV